MALLVILLFDRVEGLDAHTVMAVITLVPATLTALDIATKTSTATCDVKHDHGGTIKRHGLIHSWQNVIGRIV